MILKASQVLVGISLWSILSQCSPCQSVYLSHLLPVLEMHRVPSQLRVTMPIALFAHRTFPTHTSLSPIICCLVKSHSSFRDQLKGHFFKKPFLTPLVWNAAMKSCNQAYIFWVSVSLHIKYSYAFDFMISLVPIYLTSLYTPLGQGLFLILIIIVLLVPNTLPGTQ